MSSPAKKREELEPTAKRVKTTDGEEKVSPKKESKPSVAETKKAAGAVRPEESEEEFDAEDQEGEDSFDSDFDEPEEDHGDDDDFDIEAYKKWNETNGKQFDEEYKARLVQDGEDDDDDEEAEYEDEEDDESD